MSNWTKYTDNWTKYELELATWLANIATMDPGELPGALKERFWSLLEVITSEDTDTHAYLAMASDGRQALVFRCTASWRNVETDLEADPEHGLGATLHGGFWRAYSSVSKQIHAALLAHPIQVASPLPPPLSAWRGGPISLLVVGHSLGGALATLAALDLCYSHYNQALGLISMGAPRVGFSDFTNDFEERMEKRYVRVMYQNDLVTQVPTSPYKHPGGLLHLDEEGQELGSLTRGWLLVRNWVCSLFRFGVTLAKWVDLTDHSLVFYKQGIKFLDANWEREI